ncbi:MAG: hypothetical protein LUG44_03330, partial [Clostridiales bacterium]|nr:hypothetical protein [Clostridiales bacterium]
MKHKLKRWLSSLLAVCMVVSTSVMTANAANGTATLSNTTMTESGSIEVTFSGTASDTEYYNVQIADSSWSTTYVNTNITSGDSYTISGYSAGTYKIYIGYYEDGSWKSDALSTTTFTVTEDDSNSGGTEDTGTTNGTATLSDTTMTESGSITVNFSGTASSSEYYKIEIADSSWSTKYVDTSITSGD